MPLHEWWVCPSWSNCSFFILSYKVVFNSLFWGWDLENILMVADIFIIDFQAYPDTAAGEQGTASSPWGAPECPRTDHEQVPPARHQVWFFKSIAFHRRAKRPEPHPFLSAVMKAQEVISFLLFYSSWFSCWSHRRFTPTGLNSAPVLCN